MNNRLKELFKLLSEHKLDALLVTSWPNVSYLTGFKGTESWAFICAKGLYFITDSRYLEQARDEAKGFTVLLRDSRSVAQIVKDLAHKHRCRAVGFESDIVTHAFFESLVRELGDSILKKASGLVERLRLKKDPFEIKMLKRSAEIAVEGFHYIKRTIRPGMTERRIQADLEYHTKKLGSEKPAFDIIIAAGARASMPHCQSNQTKVRAGQPVLVDMGVVYEGYHSDLTRPIFLGRMSPFQKKIFDIVWVAQRKGIEKAGPGVAASEVDAAARDHIRQCGYAEYFGHGTGHGVGLEIHEAPSVSGRSKTILEPGMVITVEPGIYLPGKIGIRIEDMVLITKNGREVLTKGLER